LEFELAAKVPVKLLCLLQIIMAFGTAYFFYLNLPGKSWSKFKTPAAKQFNLAIIIYRNERLKGHGIA
jgi:hypothetical protein